MTEEKPPVPPSKETLSYLEKMKDPEYRRTMHKGSTPIVEEKDEHQ